MKKVFLPTFIDTKNVGNERWKPPLVDEDCHAFCQAIFQGVEGPGWEAMHGQYKDLHCAVKSKKSGENKKAKVLFRFDKSKDKGADFYDAVHLKNPTAALAKTLDRTEQKCGLASSATSDVPFGFI